MSRGAPLLPWLLRSEHHALWATGPITTSSIDSDEKVTVPAFVKSVLEYDWRVQLDVRYQPNAILSSTLSHNRLLCLPNQVPENVGGQPDGRKKALALTLLHFPSELIYIPITQSHPVLTEDQIEEVRYFTIFLLCATAYR
jgi:hypothetical protein